MYFSKSQGGEPRFLSFSIGEPSNKKLKLLADRSAKASSPPPHYAFVHTNISFLKRQVPEKFKHPPSPTLKKQNKKIRFLKGQKFFWMAPLTAYQTGRSHKLWKITTIAISMQICPIWFSLKKDRSTVMINVILYSLKPDKPL